MKSKNYSDTLHDAVENYYQYNPDTLMPLLMVALAAKGELNITSEPNSMAAARCSNKFIDAIIAGLQFSATSRPVNAQKFLNLFPGCENIKL
jgi:hypothetical protein